MRKSHALGSLLVAVSLAATGCGVSGGPEKTFKKAANEHVDSQLDFLEMVDTYQSGDSEKAEESAGEWADSFNELQTEYVCKDERYSVDEDTIIDLIKEMKPSKIPDKDDRKEYKKAAKDALKDLETEDDSVRGDFDPDNEIYVKSEHEDFNDVFGGRVYMKKEDGDWKVCEDTLSLGSGIMWNRL
ncbi:hypothetical protein [Corynebacterium macginleyi]